MFGLRSFDLISLDPIRSSGNSETQEAVAKQYEEDFYMQYDKFHHLKDLLECGKRGKSPPCDDPWLGLTLNETHKWFQN